MADVPRTGNAGAAAAAEGVLPPPVGKPSQLSIMASLFFLNSTSVISLKGWAGKHHWVAEASEQRVELYRTGSWPTLNPHCPWTLFAASQPQSIVKQFYNSVVNVVISMGVMLF